jgi:hypothetical protein
MSYSERFSDQEHRQIYADLVMSSIAHYPCGESAVLADMLSRDQVAVPAPGVAGPRFSWRGLFRLPFAAAPSLT